jgi:hypothetical protein
MDTNNTMKVVCCPEDSCFFSLLHLTSPYSEHVLLILCQLMVHTLMNDFDTCNELKKMREKAVKVSSVYLAGGTDQNCGPRYRSRFNDCTDWTVRGSNPFGGGGRDFPHLSRPALGPTDPPIQWVPGRSLRRKAAEAWR